MRSGVVEGAEVRDGADLARRTMSAIAWQSLATFGQVFLRIGVLAVLTRFVEPEEYGIVAAALVVVGASVILAEVGLGPALIQRPSLTPAHVRVAATVLAFQGAVLFALVFLAAPAIASFFRIEELVEVLRVLAVVFLIRNLTVSDFLLQRALRFQLLSMIELGSYVVGYVCLAVPLAIQGAGVWSIVAGSVAQEASRTVALSVAHRHSHRPLVAKGPFLDLFVFGGGSALSRVGQFTAHQVDNVVVGRSLGPAALGLYGRAYQLMVLPTMLFGQMLRRVMFPAMATVQDDLARLGRVYLTGTSLLALVVMPVSVVAALASHEVILMLLGDEWLELTAAFDILVFGMLFRAAYAMGDSVSAARGAVYRQAGRKGVYAVAVAIGTLAGQAWGLTGVAVGVVCALLLNYLLVAQLALEVTSTRWSQFAGAHLPGCIAALVAAAVGYPTVTAVRSVDAPSVIVVGAVVATVVIAELLLARSAPRIKGLRAVADVLGVLRASASRGRVGRGVSVLLGPAYTRPAVDHGAMAG